MTTIWHAARAQGTSAGAKDQEADNFLEKRCRGDPAFSFEETVQTAIAALQSVLSEDFKASEIEARACGSVLCSSCWGSVLRATRCTSC
jgi:20S proteasome alpha/beta subunit